MAKFQLPDPYIADLPPGHELQEALQGVQRNLEAIKLFLDELGDVQPLDADLTAIAALTTTSHGRGLLDDADAAASRTSIGTDATGAQRPPSGPETTLKVIRGIVNTAGSGTIVEGSGFTIARNSTGNVTVTFSTGFSNEPAVTGTSNGGGAIVTAYSTTAFTFLNFNTTTGAAADGIVHFHAIGPA